MTPEEREAAKLRVAPVLQALLECKRIELALVKLSLAVGKGELTSVQAIDRLNEVRLAYGQAQQKLNRVARSMLRAMDGPTTVHDLDARLKRLKRLGWRF